VTITGGHGAATVPVTVTARPGWASAPEPSRAAAGAAAGGPGPPAPRRRQDLEPMVRRLGVLDGHRRRDGHSDSGWHADRPSSASELGLTVSGQCRGRAADDPSPGRDDCCRIMCFIKISDRDGADRDERSDFASPARPDRAGSARPWDQEVGPWSRPGRPGRRLGRSHRAVQHKAWPLQAMNHWNS
jgi:hypothetical protein